MFIIQTTVCLLRFKKKKVHTRLYAARKKKLITIHLKDGQNIRTTKGFQPGRGVLLKTPSFDENTGVGLKSH